MGCEICDELKEIQDDIIRFIEKSVKKKVKDIKIENYHSCELFSSDDSYGDKTISIKTPILVKFNDKSKNLVRLLVKNGKLVWFKKPKFKMILNLKKGGN